MIYSGLMGRVSLLHMLSHHLPLECPILSQHLVGAY